MSYHYKESGLDNIWLENGVATESHPNYGDLVSIKNVRGLHKAISNWLVCQPRRLTGAEFRFLRTEADMSQRVLGDLLGVTEQAIAKWEKARDKPVANKSAERLFRALLSEYADEHSEVRTLLDRLTKLDADLAEHELRLSNNAERGWGKAA